MLTLPRPPWTELGCSLESLSRKAIYDHAMLQDVESLGIALSGGKDSLTLLFLLHALRGRGFPFFKLYALHVGGEFSCGASIAENYLSAICKELEVPLLIIIPKKKMEKLECYGCSRIRRSALFEKAKELGCSTIAFGHHRDDNAQTVLMNLLHKAEFCGMLPKIKMERYGITIIRPLLYAAERDVREFAKAYGFLRITCQCPVGQRSKRKTTDHLLTRLEEEFPHARSNISRAALLYGSDKARLV